MKLTNKEVLENIESLSTLIQDSMPLPAVVSFAVVRNFKTLQPIAEDIYKERLNILERYGTAAMDYENGTTYYDIPKEKQQAVNQELEDLLAVTTSTPLVTFALDKLTGYDIPLSVMNVLYFMVEDGEGN